jgi:hypothetical protein
MGYLVPMKCVPMVDVNSCENDSLETLVHGQLHLRSVAAWSKRIHPPLYNVADTTKGRSHEPPDKALPTL